MTASEILFGTAINSVNTVKLAAAVGVSPGTIRIWKKNPDQIPLGKLRILVKVRSMDNEKIVKVVKNQ